MNVQVQRHSSRLFSSRVFMSPAIVLAALWESVFPFLLELMFDFLNKSNVLKTSVNSCHRESTSSFCTLGFSRDKNSFILKKKNCTKLSSMMSRWLVLSMKMTTFFRMVHKLSCIEVNRSSRSARQGPLHCPCRHIQSESIQQGVLFFDQP